MASCPITDGGPVVTRRPYLAAVALLVSVTAAAAQPAAEPAIAIGRQGEAYTVAAAFDVPHPAALALTVLTDYDGIPRFMPDVKKSTVVRRDGAQTIVEQEAVSKVMLFSKRVYLRLAIDETPTSLHFRDQLGTSFVRYEGHWQLAEQQGHTRVTYHLVAQPSFGVPAFMVRRLLSRDAHEMIASLRTEMAARATRDRPAAGRGQAGGAAARD